MFKKYYKEANDDIETNRALIGKIFETAEKTAPQKKKTKIYRFATPLAAVFVVVVAMFLYPQIEKLNQQPAPYENEVQTNSDESHNEGTVDSGVKTDEKANDKQTEAKSKTQDESALSEKNANSEGKKTTSDSSQKTSGDKDVEGMQKKESANSVDMSENYGVALTSDSEETQDFSIPESVETGDEGSSGGGGGGNSRMAVYDASQNTYEIAPSAFLSVSDAEKDRFLSAMQAHLGTTDSSTGNKYSFESVGKAEAGGRVFYLGRWKWLHDGNASLIAEIALNEAMTEMYECRWNGDGNLEWSTDSNLFN